MRMWSEDFQQKLIIPENLENEVLKIRGEGKTIATLNGSFDLLHAGHLQILYEASQTADILIAALNSDSSIRQYKGPDRPIIPLKFRLQMMAAISFVDRVTWFEEIDPIRLLSIIKPDIHVNGSEYGKDCLEAEVVKENGGELHIVPLIPGLSTSQILEKINAMQKAKV